MAVFEYIIVEHPLKRDAEKGELERVVVPPTVIVAKDKEHAKTLALLKLGQDSEDMNYADNRIEVIARPFV